MRKIFFVAVLTLATQQWTGAQTPPSVETDIQRLNQSATTLLTDKKWTEAETVALEALAKAKSKSDVLSQAAALETLGLVAKNRFDYANSMSFFVQSLKIRESIGDRRGMASSKNCIGKVFLLQNNLSQAQSNFESAMSFLTPSVAEDLMIMAETQRNLGDVFLAEKIYGKAIAAYNEALKIRAENLQDFNGAADLATQLGKVTSDIGDYDAAVNNYQASLNFHRTIGGEANMATDFLNLSKAYNLLKDNELALENGENALAAFERTSDKIGVAEANCQLGKVALLRGDRALANGYFEKTASILRGANFQPRLPEILQSLSLGFSELGNFPRAYQISADYAAARDSLFNSDKAKSLMELTTRFESELNVRDKNRQLATLESKQSMEQKVRWLLVALVGLASVALYMMFKNYRQKQADNLKLKSLNDEVQRQNGEISKQNEALETKNSELKLINTRLVEEIAERERLQTAVDSKDFLLEETAAQMSASLESLERAVHENVADESKMFIKRRILVVEDNKVNQMLVANMLRKRGATVMTANDGLESLDALAAMDFDLILMDIQMPRMDGYRAVSEIRKLNNAKKAQVPIIALTASSYVNERDKAQLFGMTDHIGKPFSPDELIGKVTNALKLPKAKSNGVAVY